MKTVIKSFSSTPEGQRQMFWDAHREVAQSNQDKMARISFDAGLKDKQNNSPPRLPNIVDYMDGYNSIA